MGDLNKDPKDTKEPPADPKPNPPADGAPPAGAQNTDKTEPAPVPYARFKDLNDELKAMRTKLADIGAAEAKRQKDAEKAEEARLAEQQKYQQLAEQRETKLKELEPKLASTEERCKALEGALTVYLTKELEGVPEHIKGLLEPMPVEKRLEWLTANKAALQPATAPTPAKVPATPPAGAGGQPPTGGVDDKARSEAAKRFVRNRF